MGPRRQKPAPEPRETTPISPEARAWLLSLWRQLGIAGGIYGFAHLLLGVQHGASRWVVTPGLGVAQGLFLLGTLLLWQFTQALYRPVSDSAGRAQRAAGACLVIAMAMALSPLAWWFAAVL